MTDGGTMSDNQLRDMIKSLAHVEGEQYEVALALETGRATGEAYKRGDKKLVETLLRLWQEKPIIESKLLLLGWINEGSRWKPPETEHKWVSRESIPFPVAALQAQLLNDEDFKLWVRIIREMIERDLLKR